MNEPEATLHAFVANIPSAGVCFVKLGRIDMIKRMHIAFIGGGVMT